MKYKNTSTARLVVLTLVQNVGVRKYLGISTWVKKQRCDHKYKQRESKLNLKVIYSILTTNPFHHRGNICIPSLSAESKPVCQ